MDHYTLLHFGSRHQIMSHLMRSLPVKIQDQTIFMNWKIRREIQNPQIVQQTISPNAKRSTLGRGANPQPLPTKN
jgi:hypothetical protein